MQWRWGLVFLGLWACDPGLPADSDGGAVDAAGPSVDSGDPLDAATLDMQPADAAPDMTLPEDIGVDQARVEDMGMADMTPPTADMDRPEPDMAPPAVDMARPEPDMTVDAPDMALDPPDMAAPDMALDMDPPAPDMDPPAPDMDPPAPDMALPEADMAPPAPDMALPEVDMAPPAPDMALDPCAALDCAAAPAAVCVDDGTRRVFEPDGRCVVDGLGMARCVHDAALIECPPDEVCFAGGCGAPPPPQPGELVITELMPDPHGLLADRFAQWIELQNVSARPLALEDCVVEVGRGEAALDGELAPDALLLVGNSDERGLNGDLPIAAVFDAILSVRGGTVRVVCADVEVDRVAFGRRPEWPVLRAHAMALDPARRDPVANDDPSAWCLARDRYLRADEPEDDNFGTPGEPNRACVQQADFGRLQTPTVIVDGPGAEVQVFGRVRHRGITDRTAGNDGSPLLLAQVGYGPDGSQPDDAWIWLTAGPNRDWAGEEASTDEYQRFVILPGRGTYDLAWRFSVDEGRSWLYADAALGSVDGYDPADAADLRVEGTARVQNAGEVLISEIHYDTPPLENASQWVELHNTLDEPLDLRGCVLESPDFERAPLDGLELPARGWLAIPRFADDPVDGIESPVGFNFGLPRAGTIALTCRFEIDRVNWDDGILSTPTGGTALQLDSESLDAALDDDQTRWCPASAVFDDGRVGSPGAPNRPCPPLVGYPAAQLQRLFDVHCGDCHLRGQALGDLSLEVFELNTVDIPAAQLPSMSLITLGDRQQSYLWHKTSGTHFQVEGADGVQMPPGQPFQPGVIERMGLWIDEQLPR